MGLVLQIRKGIREGKRLAQEQIASKWLRGTEGWLGGHSGELVGISGLTSGDPCKPLLNGEGRSCSYRAGVGVGGDPQSSVILGAVGGGRSTILAHRPLESNSLAWK